MKKIVIGITAGLLAAGAALAGNIAPAYNGSNITETVTISASGDYWQQNGYDVTIGSGGTVDIQSTSRAINTTVGNGGTATSSLVIDGGLLNFNGPNAVLIGNGSAGTGVIDLRSGSFNAAPGGTLFIGRDNGSGTVLIRGGVAVFGLLPTFDAVSGDGSIDFADKIGGGVSDGTLTITGADTTYYQGLYSAGDLTFQGANTETFGDVFEVTGSTLSVIPEPATLGLVAAFGGAVLFIRRRFMM
ncbi:hypothetical protein P4E94_03205 [Pontiellaceae bacterium B12219]|nr:hypothetical protein [Pontiellaceae bacterium B12219]